MSNSLPRLLGGALAALVAVVALPQPARALDPDKPLDAYTVEIWGARNGLPSSFVRAIAQTADGYLWIAGYGGVGRYDGARIVSLPQPRPLARIFDTQTFKLDHQGTLWLISSKGTPVCLRDTVARDCLPAEVQLPEGDRLVDAHPDRDGTAWLASRTRLLRYLPTPAPHLVPVATPPLERAVFIHRDRAGRLWLGSENGLFQAEKDGQFARASDGHGPILDPVRAYFETPQGRLWFLYDRGLLRVEGGQATLLAHQSGDLGRTNQVLEDRDGNVWIGSRAGLTRVRDGRWVTHTARDGLPDDDVTVLYEDREGSLWVGTRSGGIAQFTDRVVTANPGPPSLRDRRSIASIAQDRTGATWFASRRGLVRWRSGQERLFTDRDGLPHTEVFAVLPGAHDDVWVGTARGFARVRGDTIDVPKPLPEMVAALHVDGAGALWLGAGPRLLHYHQDQLREIAQSTQGLIRNIESNPAGRIWVAANLGIARLDGGQLVPLVFPGGDYPGRALHRDREGRIWATVGTDIARISPGPVRLLGPAVGLGGRQLFQLADDDRGYFWIGTSRGLLRLPKARMAALADGQRITIDPLSLETDDQRRDIIANNTRDPGVWKDNAGRMWFATDQGALMIDPARLRVNEQPPPIRIDEATADRHPLQRGQPNLLGPGPGNLAFRFTAVTLLEPHKSLHRYRLEGFDQSWVDAGARREAYYTNIPPGQYRFHVQGSNADGVWNQEGDVIQLRLRPHFYQTGWFYGGVGLLALGALVLLWRLRVRGLRREYQGALAERARVARELHDTLLQGMSAAALKLRGLRRRHSADVATARELASIDSLVVTALQETRQFLGGLRGQGGAGDLAVALERLGSQLTETGDITCAVVVEGDTRPLPDDVKGDLFRIAQEAIHNAVKHARPKRIDVRLRYAPQAAALTVADDGCGFDQSGAAGAAQGHFGLVGMRERGARVGDFHLTSQPGQGTTIQVTVPIENTGRTHD